MTTSKSKRPVVVLLDTTIPDTRIEEVRRLSPRIEVAVGRTPEALRRATVAYTEGNIALAQMPALGWVQTDSAAVHHLVNTPLARSGLPVCNVGGAYSPAVAEFAWTLLLALSRRLPRCLELQQASEWVDDYVNGRVRGRNCCGKTIGIVGYGSIGRQVARLAHAAGMKVLACKRNPAICSDNSYLVPNTGDPRGRIPTAWFGLKQLDKMLPRLDACVVTLPLTGETRGLLDRRRLALLPAHALLINVGRGGTVDEAALAEMLADGRLAGAGFDVFSREPLDPESPLWRAPNTIVTPHIASYTDEQPHLAADVLVANLRRYLAGRKLLNVVDLRRGY